MIELLKQCQENRHNLIEIYRIEIDDFYSDVIRWCKTCGCVKGYKEIDYRPAGSITDIYISDVAKAYWDEKYDSSDGTTTAKKS